MKIKNEATEKKCEEIADMYWKTVTLRQ